MVIIQKSLQVAGLGLIGGGRNIEIGVGEWGTQERGKETGGKAVRASIYQYKMLILSV